MKNIKKKINKEKISRFGSINIVDKEFFVIKLFRIFKFFITGNGVERDMQRVSFVRYFCNNTIIFKLIGRYLSWRFKYTKDKHITNLDLDQSNLKEIYDYTVEQNLSQLNTGSSRRAEIYYKLLTLPPTNAESSKVLIIGAKSVIEIFIAWLYGFKWKNIYAIDLFSLHPKIKIMSMEDISFNDNSFDCVSMANVYGYNDNPMPAFYEIVRVLKKGGMLSFNSVYQPDGKTETYRTSADQLIKIFKELGLSVIYHDQNNNISGTRDIWLLKKEKV
jgi:SAM-dependent methyltransferase